MIRLLRAWLAVAASSLELFAAHLSENAKSYGRREFYRGYRQGVVDGMAGAEHALKWLTEKETKR